jgi:diphthamide synthase (EF-2-diphthine--ammonia ligase)
MHAVRRVLLQAQADALGLPLHIVELPWPCSNSVYEQQMAAAITAASADEVEHIVFGDLFLQDVRAYREKSLIGTGITPLFPLWHRPTTALAAEIVAAGIRAVVTCVDPAQAPPRLVGRWYDRELLRQLPPAVDRCGERGEFHTFVADGPGFAHPLPVIVGDVVERDGFVFADVLPADRGSTAGAALEARHGYTENPSRR